MAIDLRQLRQFVTIAELGSYRRAADALHIAQPALSVSIQKLEHAVGVPLLVRGAKGVSTTPAGDALMADARRALFHTDQARQAARRVFADAGEKWQVDDRETFVEDVRRALLASKIVAYAQGFDHIRAGSREYDWNIDLGGTATIWRGGCIIRAGFLDRIREAYDAEPDLATLLVAPWFAERVSAGVPAWRRVVADAARAGVPAPAFGSSLAYFDALRAQRLPAALIQGLRDNFGAHTYHRVDRDGSFHTLWAGDRSEVEA